MKEKVTLDIKGFKRLKILDEMEFGDMKRGDAAACLGLSVRQVSRLIAAFRAKGPASLSHGNTARRPANALDVELTDRVLELSRSTYAGFNTQHLTDALAEREGMLISRSSVRRILLAGGAYCPRKRRPPKHRSRRERQPQEGMLLQIDASQHDWLGSSGPRLSLIAAIDDATGKVLYALFREQEDAHGYFLLLQRIVEENGVPLAVYHDRHGIFERSRKEADSLLEQLEGKRTPTQFGRMLQDLGITSISSNSPQARGRIERLWGTLQGRLVSELRLAGACTLEAANRTLWSYLPRFNQTFAVRPTDPGSAYLALPDGHVSEQVFCFKYNRTVGTDNVVPLGEHRLQIMPGNGRLSYARTRVEVHERLDGSIAVFHNGNCLACKPAPVEAPTLRARRKGSPPSGTARPTMPARPTVGAPPGSSKPAPDHPWRKRFKSEPRKGVTDSLDN